MQDLAAVDFVPRQLHAQRRLAHVAALVPERVIAAVAGRAARIVEIAVHRAERGQAEAAERVRMRFAMIEEGT
ncbi:hypothetical protein [Xanthomonas translucens]|uniref:hypothetical protein n=1 Tax=Xanthomonas campestris pv. translucens TaxID=343 RepID=UPI0012DB2FD0